MKYSYKTSKIQIFTEAAQHEYQIQAPTLQQAKMPQTTTLPHSTLTLPQLTKQPCTPTLMNSTIITSQ